VCGETRVVPAALTVVSCVKCGRKMAATDVQPTLPPPRARLAGVTLLSQLVAACVFGLALWCFLRHAGPRGPIVGIMVASAVGVFAGGAAHRGSLFALACCAVIDVAIGVTAIYPLPAARPYAAMLFAKVPHANLVMPLGGVVALVAALACLLVVPDVRRFARWFDRTARRRN